MTVNSQKTCTQLYFRYVLYIHFDAYSTHLLKVTLNPNKQTNSTHCEKIISTSLNMLLIVSLQKNEEEENTHGIGASRQITRKWTNRHTAKVSSELHVVEVGTSEAESVGKKKSGKLKPETIDKIAFFVFLVLFLAFNVFYWTYFVTS